MTCILTAPLQKAGPNLYGCEVVDKKGFRADLYIKEKELKSDLLSAKKGNKMILDGTVVTISGFISISNSISEIKFTGDCMNFNLDSASKLKFSDNKIHNMAEVLKTPIKRKCCDAMDEKTPKKK